MTRTLLILALVALAGTAGAQGNASDAEIAQKRIETEGYRNVQGLAKGDDGLWHGTATRGNAEVRVTVDRSGNVIAK